MLQIGMNNKNWVQIDQCSMSSLLGAQIIFDQFNNFSWHLNGLRFRNLILVYKDHLLQTFVTRADLDFIIQSLKPRFLAQNKEIISGIKAVTSPSYKNLNALLRQLRRAKISALEDEQLSSIYLDLYQIILNEIFLVNFKPLELAALAALGDRINELVDNPVQAENDLAMLATMDKPSFSTREEIDLCQIVDLTLEPGKICRALSRTKDRPRLVKRNYPDLYELLKEHHKKYKYLVSGFSEYEWRIDDTIRRYVVLLNKGPDWITERIGQLSAHTRNIGKMKRAIYSRTKDKQIVGNLSNIISDLAMLAENNRMAYGQALAARELLNNELVERVGVEIDELAYYTIDELLDLINNRKVLDEKEILRRNRGVVFNSGISFHSGSNATRFLEKQIAPQPRRSILQGQCAWPGRYEGRVTIVRSMEDAVRTEYGDVVVSASAGVEFTEAIRKAGAVIVESSGMIEPAAQLCREMNTPCLIGVQGALASLKSGAQVIVDTSAQTVCMASAGAVNLDSVDVCSIKVFDYNINEPSLVRLEDVLPDDTMYFGTKAATLALLSREGFQIPDGFVIGRAMMYRFLTENGCKIVEGAYDPSMVKKARACLTEESSTSFLKTLPLDATVIFDEDGCAVRGSWLPGDIAGERTNILTTTLAIRTLEGLWKAIRKCWLTFIDHPLAIMEKDETRKPQAVGGGVIIQQYKPGDRSGQIASLDLGYPGSNVITLEAFLGTGHSHRTTKARPDRYRISRKTERIINRIIPLKTRFEMVQPRTGKLILIPVPEDIVEAEVLTRQQIKILVSSVLRIEKMLEKPVRMEWSIKGGEIYIMSATTLTTE